MLKRLLAHGQHQVGKEHRFNKVRLTGATKICTLISRRTKNELRPPFKGLMQKQVTNIPVMSGFSPSRRLSEKVEKRS